MSASTAETKRKLDQETKKHKEIHLIMLGHDHADDDMQRITQDLIVKILQFKIPLICCVEMKNLPMEEYIHLIEKAVKRREKEKDCLDQALAKKPFDKNLQGRLVAAKQDLVSTKRLLKLILFIQKRQILTYFIDTPENSDIRHSAFESQHSRQECQSDNILKAAEKLKDSGGIILTIQQGRGNTRRLTTYITRRLQERSEQHFQLVMHPFTTINSNKNEFLIALNGSFLLMQMRDESRDAAWIKELYKTIRCVELEYAVDPKTNELYLPKLDKFFNDTILKSLMPKTVFDFSTPVESEFEKRFEYLNALRNVLGNAQDGIRCLEIDKSQGKAYAVTYWLDAVKAHDKAYDLEGYSELLREGGIRNTA